MGIRACSRCSGLFETIKSQQRYCTRKCKDRARGKRQRESAKACVIVGCGRGVLGGLRAGLCGMHYVRKRRTGETGASGSTRPGGRFGIAPCAVEGCDRKYYAKDMCSLHYNRHRTSGNIGPPELLKRRAGEGCYISDAGYRYVVFQAGAATKGRRTKKIAEHRMVMEGMLGRPLEPFENVHHKNGVRNDNRPENLELWVKPQPSGQRPEDLAAWVCEYYPELVTAEMKARQREQRTGQLRLVVS